MTLYFGEFDFNLYLNSEGDRLKFSLLDIQ